MSQTILGVIPCRGASKGIPRKGLYPLNGVPLIAYTILAAKKSRLDDFIVTTDDDTIREVSEQYGAKVIRRPAELARDDTPMVPVVQHAVAEYERDGDYVDAVCLLQPTSPLRTADDIDQCLELFGLLSEPYTSVVTVYEGLHPKKSYSATLRSFADMLNTSPVYDKHTDRCYTRNGAVFICRRWLLDAGKLWGDPAIYHVMPHSRSIDIDTLDDLRIAEALLKAGVVS